MLRVISRGLATPESFPVHPSAEFEPGMIAQFVIVGNDTVITVSDGTAPIGIIDDVRTKSFTKPQIDEVIEINVEEKNIEIDENMQRVNSNKEIGFLEFSNLIESSFTSDVSVILNYVNGAVTVPAGTPLNYDSDGDGILDSFKIVASYVYRIANKPGDDSTLGSNKVTVHYQRGIYATDQYDPIQIYPLNATLYVGLDGKLTTKQPSASHPGIAFVVGQPTSLEGTLQFIWL